MDRIDADDRGGKQFRGTLTPLGDILLSRVASASNLGLTNAKKAKQDEFYTQYVDIQKEVEAYLEFDPDTFRGKVVYCNCDDPFESNFRSEERRVGKERRS